MRKRVLLLIATVLLMFNSKASSSIDMGNYCYYPPTITGPQIKPNVLIVLDASKTMQYPAYLECNNPSGEETINCWAITSSYDPSRTYYGYFDPNKCYKKRNPSGFEENNTCNCSNKIGSIDCISGNILNWATATRIDIARWVLTGGRTSTAGGNTFLESEGAKYTLTDTTTGCTFEVDSGPPSNRQVKISGSSCPITLSKTDLKIRVSDPGSIKGVIHSFCDTSDLNGQINEKCKLIMELMVFGSRGSQGKIEAGKTTTLSRLFNAINTITPSGGKPIGKALWEAYDYYKQANDNNYEMNSDYINRGNANVDPYYDGSGGNSHPVSCRKGFVLLISDGVWDGTVDPVVPARDMATQDLRDDLSGRQSVYTYVVYTFGTHIDGRQSMITTAIFGGFEDKDNNTWPYPFTNIQFPSGSGTCASLGETIRTNIQTTTNTYCNSRGVTYPLSQCNPSGTWNSWCAEWDTVLNSLKDGLPYNFFEADDAPQLRNALLSALTQILNRATSSSSLAVLTSRGQSSNIVVQPLARPLYTDPQERTVSWIGHLRSLWIDPSQQLREDSVLDKILQLLGTYRDKIIQFLFDPDTQETRVVLRDPAADTCSESFAGSKRLEEINYLLMHDCALANLQSAGGRKIYYRRYGNFREFSTSNWNELKDVWNQVDGTIADYNEVERIINYLRGEYDYTYLSGTDADRYTARKRQFDNSAICPGYSVISSNPPPWKLGFINASTPSVVGSVPLLDKWVFIYGDASYRAFVSSWDYKNRRFVAIVGTYDGMLHFFRIGKLRETEHAWFPVRLEEDEDGKEEYAIIPENALPYMLWYGREDYCPVPIIDYRSQVVDLPLNGGSGSPLSENSWRTYLIGVMGFGGKRLDGKDFSSSVFMLDLTDYLINPNNPPRFVFERKLDNYELTTSFPVVVRQLTDTSSPEKNGKFYLILGSGPLDPYADSKDKFTDNPRLYVIQLSDGINPYFKQFTLNNLPELPGTERKFAVGDLVVLDLDNDKRDDVIYFGVYGFYKQGSNWKWFGGLYRLAFKIEPTNPWDRSYKEISELNNDDIKPVIVLADNNFSGPVFGRPSATLDEQGNLWVYFATGIYTSPEHKNSPWGDNYIFGIKDPCWDPANRWFRRSCSPVYRADLKDQTNVDLQYSSVVEQETICTCDLTGCGEQTVVRRVVPTNFNDILNDMTSYKGWYVNIGKRLSYSAVQVFGGYVYAMATEFPETQDICQQTPKTRLYALYYLTGTGAPNVGILMPGIAGGGRVEKSVDLGFGSAPLGPVLQVARSSSGELLAVFQTSIGAIQKVRLQSAHAGQLRRILWIEK